MVNDVHRAAALPKVAMNSHRLIRFTSSARTSTDCGIVRPSALLF